MRPAVVARSLDASIDALQPVGLDVLDDVAALRTRFDRKYIVPLAVAGELVEEFAAQTRTLEIGGERVFGYESLYFDTADLASYRAAAHKRRRRFKVRTRVYRDRGTCVFEVKTKGVRGVTVKHRVDHSMADRYAVTPEAAIFVDEHLGRIDLGHALQPTLHTAYRRRTLLDAARSSRVTIDTDLEVAGLSGDRRTLQDVAIVETKSSGAALDQDRWLWARGVRPMALSKYCIGLALLRPSLPSNRWRSALRELDELAAPWSRCA